MRVLGFVRTYRITVFPCLRDFGRAGEVNVRYRVELSETERLEWKEMISGGQQSVRRLKRAQILLASDAGQSEEALPRS